MGGSTLSTHVINIMIRNYFTEAKTNLIPLCALSLTIANRSAAPTSENRNVIMLQMRLELRDLIYLLIL